METPTLQLTDDERAGVVWVASFMGHMEVAEADPARIGAAASAARDLTTEGLAAASRHVQLCTEALGIIVEESPLSDDEKADYYHRRSTALLGAAIMVRAETVSRGHFRI